MAKLKIENTYIMSFKAEKLIANVKCEDKKIKSIELKEKYEGVTTYLNKKGETKTKRFPYLYGCSLPYSLDVIALNEFAPEEIKTNYKGKQYTDAIINVKFPSKWGIATPDKKVIMEKKDIRRNLYQKGFWVNGSHYVEYKRSSSKARTGSTLFIREDLYEPMIKWSRMGLEFKSNEPMDVASLRAYESLTLSGLEDLITIKKDQIVIIDDQYSVFKELVSVTEQLESKKVVTENKTVEIENNLWDGQCLLDHTVFNKAKRYDKGFMLLRNRFFKGAAFNTRIYDFLRSKKVDTVTDMFGREFKAKDVKLIITPSCLKILKFSYKKGTKKDMYEFWLDTISEVFGICKSEKPSHYDDYHKLSYQMINALPLSKEDVTELAQVELDYINNIKTDDKCFLKHIDLDDKSATRSAINTVARINPKFMGTELFRRFKSDTISAYKKQIRKGKLKIPGTDYCTVVGNPYEMLLHTIGKFDGTSQTLKGYEVYTTRYEDGEMLAGFRNPLIASGNVLYAKNRYNDNFTWFKLTNNIAIINNIDCNILQRCQGMDQDSDTVLLSNYPLVVEKAKQCQTFLVPVNGVKAKVVERLLTWENKAEVDDIIQNNAIGQIVNQSQVCNSYYWDRFNAGIEQKKLEQIYKEISKLSSLSQIEIDKAKKLINIPSSRISTGISRRYNENPLFMSYIKDKIQENKLRFFDCPMDYLQQVVDDIENSPRVTPVKMEALLRTDLKGSVNKSQIDQVTKIIQLADDKIKAIRIEMESKSDEDRHKDLEQIYEIEQDCIEQLSKKTMNSNTIATIIRRMCSENSKDKSMNAYRMRMFKSLALSQHDNFVKCFVNEKKA